MPTCAGHVVALYVAGKSVCRCVLCLEFKCEHMSKPRECLWTATISGLWTYRSRCMTLELAS